MYHTFDSEISIALVLNDFLNRCVKNRPNTKDKKEIILGQNIKDEREKKHDWHLEEQHS